MFEGGVHVPAFMYSASTSLIPSSKQGSVFNELFHVTDWMPTILAAIDASVDSRPTAHDDIDGVDQWSNIIAAEEDQTQMRDDILLHATSWTSCCTSTSGEASCTGFLSTCADSTTAVLTPMTNPRGAILSSNGYKLIINEYDIPWFGIPTAGSSSTSDVTVVGVPKAGEPGAPNPEASPAEVVPPRKLLSTDDATTTDDVAPNVKTSKESTGNAMSNCGSEPNTNTLYWLFDLSTDPTETTNLYGTLPDIEKELKGKFEAYLKKEVRPNWVNGDSSSYATWKANGGFICPWM